MHGRERPPLRERLIAQLAGVQHGVVALYQLLELGFTTDEVDYRISGGRLHRVHVGVYAVGHHLLTRHGRWMAAVLAYGPAAVLSYRDAAALWRIYPSASALIHVTGDRYTRNPRPGLKLHRPRHLDRIDCTVHEGIPVTTVARTLIDLAGDLSLEQLTRAWDEAERLRLFDLRAVEDVRSRSRGRQGLSKIDHLIAQRRPAPKFTRSGLERLGLETLRGAGDIPEPSTNVWLAGMEVDCFFRDHGLVVEWDSAKYHGTLAARNRDNRRSAELQAAGFRVLRVADHWLANAPDEVVATVRRMLAAAS